MIWDSVISAASGLGGALVGAYVTRRGESARLGADEAREVRRLEREDAATNATGQAVARIEVERLAATYALFDAARDQKVWMGPDEIDRLPERLPISQRETLARLLTAEEYKAVAHSESSIDLYRAASEIAFARYSGDELPSYDQNAVGYDVAHALDVVAAALRALERLSGMKLGLPAIEL